ncbi:MAG: DUF4342 domain-containing protein [Patescibacteria group bacterium]
MEQQFEKVTEISGEDLKKAFREGFDDLYNEIKKIVKQGNDCRITLTEPSGRTHTTTATAGTIGFGLMLVLAPIVVVLGGLTGAVVATFFDWKLTIEKVVEAPAAEASATEKSV